MERSGRIGIRVRPADKQIWKETAEEAGLSLSAWIEKTLNNEANECEEDGGED